MNSGTMATRSIHRVFQTAAMTQMSRRSRPTTTTTVAASLVRVAPISKNKTNIRRHRQLGWTVYRHYSSSSTANNTGDDDADEKSNHQTDDSNKNDDDIPWRVAIVGSGPSGCYTAKYLQSGMASKLATKCSIDVLERLPTPYGLVRNGVAPDHPEVKNVMVDFDALFSSNNNSTTNSSTTIRYYGNVRVGTDVTLQELRERYDIVVLAYGCESDRELDLPVVVAAGTVDDDDDNKSTTTTRTTTTTTTTTVPPKGVLSARQFVNWYNGHPEFGWVTDHVRDSFGGSSSGGDDCSEEQPQRIVVVGHGNVALDCARILAKSRAALDPTDLTTRALDVLHHNTHQAARTKREISVVGRRGHVQSAFTIKEVRELTKLSERTTTATTTTTDDDARLVVRPDELELGTRTTSSRQELKTSRPKTRIHKLLSEYTAKTLDENNDHLTSSTTTTNVHLRFLINPVRYEVVATTTTTTNNNNNESSPSPPSKLKLSAVVCERTRLEGETPQRAVGTGIYERIPADLCLVSIGYRGLAIDDLTASIIDDNGVLRNDHGRIVVANDDNDDDNKNNHRAPLYVSGWLKRGPSGIIGTNIGDAKDTVVSILEDIATNKIVRHSSSANNNNDNALESLLEERGIPFVDWNGYRNIEHHESTHKRHPDQPREKLVDTKQLLEAAKGTTPSSSSQ